MGQLLLSSEYFSREFTEDELLRMQVLLARLGVTELTFSVYIRRPRRITCRFSPSRSGIRRR
jgi:hypothetical protein